MSDTVVIVDLGGEQTRVQAAAAASQAIAKAAEAAASASAAHNSEVAAAASAAIVGGLFDFTGTLKSKDIITKGPWADVRAFGAKGDGTTDDTSAIIAAVSSGSKTVTGGRKTYRITDQIVVPAGVVLKNINFLVDYTPAVQGSGVVKCTGKGSGAKNIDIDGNGKPVTGVEMSGADKSKVENVNVNNTTWGGLYAKNTTNSAIKHVSVTNCGGVSLGGMIQIDDGCTNVHVSLSNVDTTPGKGFVVGGDNLGANNISFYHCTSLNNEGEGLYPRRGCNNVKFVNCKVIKEATMPYNVDKFSSGVKCSRGGQNIVFDQCVFETYLGNDNAPPFQIQGCSYVKVKDTVIKTLASGGSTRAVLVNWHPTDNTTVPPTVATPANHIKFLRCTIDPGGGEGVRLTPGSGFTNLEDIEISECTFQNYTTAVYSNLVVSPKILGNIFKNSAYQTSDTQDTILVIGSSGNEQYSRDVNIYENLFEAVSGYAVRTGYSKNIKVGKNSFTGKTSNNTFILLQLSTIGLVEKNTFYAPFNTCLNLDTTASGFLVESNQFLGGGAGTAIRQNGTNQTIGFNNFDVLVPLNPINGGTRTTVFGNSNRKIFYDTAAPTTGTWAVADVVYNASPSGGGYVGWVCTVAGTPGTWKGFGAIQA